MLPFKAFKYSKVTKEKPLVLVGLGNMGKAMLRGWVKTDIDKKAIRVITPRPELALEEFPELQPSSFLRHPDDMDDQAGAIILAVKPQKMDEVAPLYKKFVPAKPIFLSIAAGKNISYFEKVLSPEVPIVRCMPNTPCAIGYGLSGMIGNALIGSPEQDLCTTLMSSVGQVIWLDKDKEDLMNVITGLSGSGPAFLFHYVECVYRAGLNNGLTHMEASLLANSTVIGSAMLLSQRLQDMGGSESMDNLIATQLRQQVTSPNGTTFAGLTMLMDEDNGLQSLMNETVRRAIERSRELGKPKEDDDNKD